MELAKLSVTNNELRHSDKPLEPSDGDDETFSPSLSKIRSELDTLRDVVLQHGKILEESLIQQVLT